jgi:DNA invertase Pin-like site-specific DNA recombinase
MRCAIYTRVSTDEQAASDYSSLKRQEEICRNYVDIHTEKGWQVAGLYEDAGYSGKDFQRPGIQELLDDVRTGRVDAIVTYKIDRISRSLKDFYDLWEVLKSHNVTFVSATQHFDTSDSMGMLILNILLSFAQFERELTRERTMSKMAGRAERGLWNGGIVPLGFTYEKATQALQPDEHEAPIIRFIFRRVIETHPLAPSLMRRTHGATVPSCAPSPGVTALCRSGVASASMRTR